jgi:hypothetical protein
MGVIYLHIDSKDRMQHETTSKMLVRLSTPIQKATSVKLVSFSTANELYNIDEGNNVLTIHIQDFTVPIFNAIVEPLAIVIRVPAGVYTTERLIEAINVLIYERYPNDEDRANLDIAFELLDDGTNRVSIVTNPVEDLPNQPIQQIHRVTLYYPPTGQAPPFGTSVIHRLGFSRQQVCPHRVPFGVVNIANDGEVTIHGFNFQGNAGVPENDVEYIRLHPQSPPDDTATSNNIGWETHPFVYILSDELVKHATRTHGNANGSVATTNTDILQKIPINTNLYNWIHFFGSEYTFEHQLDGRTIHHFDISLANSERQVFPNRHFKDFQLTLEFKTMENDEEVNEAAITALAKKGYDIRHSR